jgi:hypothetical protein
MYKKFILVTDFDNSGEDVLIFAKRITAEQIESILKAKKQAFNECYSIRKDEISFYCNDPCFLSELTETKLLKQFTN